MALCMAFFSLCVITPSCHSACAFFSTSSEREEEEGGGAMVCVCVCVCVCAKRAREGVRSGAWRKEDKYAHG